MFTYSAVVEMYWALNLRAERSMQRALIHHCVLISDYKEIDGLECWLEVFGIYFKQLLSLVVLYATRYLLFGQINLNSIMNNPWKIYVVFYDQIIILYLF